MWTREVNMRSVSMGARLLAGLLGGAALLELVRVLSGGAFLAAVLPEVVALPLYGGASLLVLLVWLAAAVGLMAFTWVSTANILSFEPDFYETPLRGVLGWLIPGWNLYKPYDSLAQIWSGTANHPLFEEPAGPDRRLDLFWACWVLAIVAGRVFGGGEGWVGGADVLGAVLSAISGLAGAAVVLRIASLQEQVRQRATARA
jgi:hypothetical protein